jgi:two-component system, LytTR family, sensor kinase
MILQKVLQNRKLLFLLNLAFWIVLAAFECLQHYLYQRSMDEESSWFRLFSYVAPKYFLYWLASLVVYSLYHKLTRFRWPAIAWLHLFCSICIAWLHTLLCMAGVIFLRMNFGSIPGKPMKSTFIENYQEWLGYSHEFLIPSFMMYWLMILILFAYDTYKKYRDQYIVSVELESKLTRSQLQTLKMQLQPHFLFNALNTISMMIRRKKDEDAIEIVSGLSDLLRSTLTREGEQFVTLDDEMDLLSKYLNIEKVRFKDKLQIHFEIDPECRDILVPNLILQPIVENAFKHGVSKRIEGSELRVEAKMVLNHLHISILNRGPLLPEGWHLNGNKGIGLSNTLSRLQQLYGNESDFNISNFNNIGVRVELYLPVKHVERAEVS